VPITVADPFKGRQYPGEVILQAVRWYLRYPFRPLQQFQHSTLRKEDVLKLLRTLKNVLGSKPPEMEVIRRTFEEWRFADARQSACL
jgi:hypothetical protein